MTSQEQHVGGSGDICDVCRVPMSDVTHPVTEDAVGLLMTFCSSACHEEYVKDPHKYQSRDEEVESQE